MSRFNKAAVNPRKTTNYEGEKAYTALDVEQQLYAVAAADFLTNSFYTSEAEKKQRIGELVAQNDPEFVGRLADYIRHELYLRTIPIYMLAHLANLGSIKPWMVTRVVSRADELKELCAAWMDVSGKNTLKKFPHALQDGLAKAFGQFNAFQFRKYNKQGKEDISFKDVLRVVHPKPMNDSQRDAYYCIAKDELPAIETWETELSANQGTKKEIWERLVLENKIPYMAMLRNIRNMIQADCSKEVMDKVFERLADKEQVLRSKQFPFRFYSAYTQLAPMAGQYYNIMEDCLEQALQHSAENIPGFSTLRNQSILIACDVSGSMSAPLSDKSSVRLVDVGIILGRLLASKCKYVETGVFGSEWQPFPFGRRVLTNTQLPRVGLSTYGYKVLDWARRTGKQFDKIIFFSDNQIYGDLGIKSKGFWGHIDDQKNRSQFEQSFNGYINMSPNTQVYMFDLGGYGMFPVDLLRPNVYMVSGWSTNVFRVLDELASWKNFKSNILGYNSELITW